MQSGYQDNHVPEQPYSSDRSPHSGSMKPFETGYSDGADEENDFHHDSQYVEDELRGKSGVMRNDGVGPRKSHCHPNNKYILIAGVVFVALALGAGISVSKNKESEDTSLSLKQPPAPVPVTTPVPTLPPTPSPIPLGPRPTWSPTHEPPPSPFTQSFQARSDLFFPPERDPSLPAYINPSTEFGHIVALNFEGDQFVVAMRSSPDDPPNYYGGFHLYRMDPVGKKFIWEQLVHVDLASPPTTANHHQSMSFRDNKLAISQGNEVATFFQEGANYRFDPLGPNLKDFGTINSNPNITSLDWYVSQVALSPSGMLLSVLLSNTNDQPGMVEIYRYILTHNHSGVFGEWDFKARIPLATKVSGGSMAFSDNEMTFAVGTFDDSNPESITETLASFSSDTASVTWTPAGNPKLQVDSVVTGDGSTGGSVMSLSNNGQFMAVGSKDGGLNQVVMLKWNSNNADWEPYGDSSLLVGKTPDSRFGTSLQIDSEGRTVYVGAPGGGNTAGSVFAYQYNPSCNCWKEYVDPLETDTQGNMLGTAVACDHFLGTHVIVGYPGQTKDNEANPIGAIRIFQVADK